MNLILFAEKLKELILEKDGKISIFIQNIKISKTAVYEYLTGNKEPTVKNLLQIANYFNCSIDFLIGIEVENYSQSFLDCPPFSQRLNELLKYFDISRYKLEKMTGISQSTLYYWSINKTVPTVDSLLTISKCLNCSLDFILGRTNLQ